MMNVGAMGRRRAHAEVAEEKAGHGRGMMKEDVLPAADRSRLRGVRRLNYGERGGGV